ncbi:MAG: YybS family protein, partial [Gemmatimonadota bacterium]|nr:YybS family protein [Gemmatimonadota bacterium]
ALLATAGFGLLSRRTTWTVPHRALAAIAIAAVGIAVAFVLFGWSWDRLHWWMEFRTGPALRLLLGRMATATPGEPGRGGAAGPAFEESLESLVRTSAELFPAALALQLLVSLVLAAWVARRLTGVSVGRPLGRFAEFTFSEHLGWLLAVAIVALLIPGLGGARPLAINLLVVLGTLYFARGVAVLLYGIRALGGGPLLYVGAGLALFFLLPGVILLGVVDAGLNLRRRRAPRTGA